MSVSEPTPATYLGRLRAAAIALELLLGVGAVGGGIALMAGPAGSILPLPVIVATHDEKIIPTFKRIYNIRDGRTVEEAGQGQTHEPS